jgi:undecaprenyl-diphosphatase
MTMLGALILGIIEGVTEFLPVSSTGHLILASSLLNIAQSDFTKSFEIIIQLGAILSIVVIYWREFLKLALLKKLVVAFIPTGIIGLALYKVIKTYLIGNESVVLWALFIGGILLIIFEFFHKEPEHSKDASVSSISYKQSFLMGLAQAVSIIPGTSRSAATIVGGLMLGLPRRVVVEFSFLLAVPTMLAATGLDLVKNASSFSLNNITMLLIGFVVSFVVAFGSVKWLLSYVKKHNFVPFGIYRILLALLFWFVIL